MTQDPEYGDVSDDMLLNKINRNNINHEQLLM